MLFLTNIEYIDVSGIGSRSPGEYISTIVAAQMHADPVLVFMPNLDYKGMYEAESLASKFNVGFIVVPITLPILDLTKQMEFAGVQLTQDLISGIESVFRKGIIQILNEDGVYIEC